MEVSTALAHARSQARGGGLRGGVATLSPGLQPLGYPPQASGPAPSNVSRETLSRSPVTGRLVLRCYRYRIGLGAATLRSREAHAHPGVGLSLSISGLKVKW